MFLHHPQTFLATDPTVPAAGCPAPPPPGRLAGGKSDRLLSGSGSSHRASHAERIHDVEPSHLLRNKGATFRYPARLGPWGVSLTMGGGQVEAPPAPEASPGKTV